MKNLFKKAVQIYLCILIGGCIAIVKTGVPKHKYKTFYDNQALYYKIEGIGRTITMQVDMGRCGSGLYIALGLPIPSFGNTCEEQGFWLNVSAGPKVGKPSDPNEKVFLKYNNITYMPYGNVGFKIENFEEFKNAKDKTIIIKENGKIIAEIPFDWKLKVWVF